MKSVDTKPIALTIAGSDSGGGAGIQADLKTFTALKVFGTSAVTCVTAQNPSEVRGVEPMSPSMVSLQIQTVCHGFRVAAAKTGMLYSAEIIDAVARTISDCAIPLVVVDPVMVATSGARLLKQDAVEALTQLLVPHACILTPNMPEAEILSRMRVDSMDSMRSAAKAIRAASGIPCVVKGGHGETDIAIDILDDGETVYEFKEPRVPDAETHGTGCTFSAAIAAYLARGATLPEAVKKAKAYVTSFIRASAQGANHPGA